MAFKLPTLVERFYKQQEKVKELHRAVTAAEVAEKREQIKLDRIGNEIQDRFKKDEIDGLTSKTAVAKLKKITGATVTDWRKVTKYIKANNAFEIFQRRINKAAWLEHLEARKQRPIPGIKKFQRVTLSVTKKKGH